MSESSQNRWAERLADVARASLVAGLVWMGVDIAGAQTIDAKALYQQHCAVCHGEQRTGAMGPALLPESLVRIRLTEKMPLTSWNAAAPREYGFFSNVNPQVDHPRWSQASERRIGEDGLFAKRRPTLMFNGYAEQVGSLYTGLDLRRWF